MNHNMLVLFKNFRIRLNDMASVVQCFYKDDILYVFPHYFLPSDTIKSSKNVMYSEWVKDGWLHSVPGPIIDPVYVLKFIEGICNSFSVVNLGADPALMTPIAAPLADLEWPIGWVPQGYKMSDPAKTFQSWVLTQRIRYANPVFAWNAGNCQVLTDRNENIYVCKEVSNSPKLIDGVIGCIMALYSLVPDLYSSDGSWYIPD